MAASWYSQHLSELKDVLNKFDKDEAVAIKECQDLLEKDSLASDLAFIHCHLAFLAETITKLEKAGLTLVDALSLLEETKDKINSIPGSTGEMLQSKLTSVLAKNPGLEAFGKVGKVLEGKNVALPEGISPGDAAALKFCPLVSVDVERSFSVYKSILSDRRHHLTKENLSKIMICHCFYGRGE